MKVKTRGSCEACNDGSFIPVTTLTHLECSRCATKYDPASARGLCDCGAPLLARYDLEMARTGWSRDWVKNAPSTMWRYAPVLPVRQPPSITSLGEGMTPLIHARRFGERLGVRNLWIKDEGVNPTGSFQSRGISCAVSMAVELGITKVALRASASGGSALAAYAAAAGIQAHVFLQSGAPAADYVACRAHGARVTLGDATPAEGWFDLSALREPYRIEGAKTIAYEIAEQLSWTLPDAIVCPAGDGLVLMGASKAFEELEQLAWTAAARPRMITAPTVTSRDAIAVALELASAEGIFAAPEGAAAIAALPQFLTEGIVKADERIVVVNTESGLKHIETYAIRFPHAAAGEHDKLSGLITPR